MKYKFFYLFLAAAVLIAFPVLAKDDPGELYQRGLRAMRSGSQSFAFFDLRRLIEQYPQSKYIKPALFLMGEIYY